MCVHAALFPAPEYVNYPLLTITCHIAELLSLDHRLYRPIY